MTLEMALELIAHDGWVKTSAFLSKEGVDMAVAHLKSRPVYPGCHVRYTAGPATTWEKALSEHVLCWSMEDALTAPGLLDCALSNAHIAKRWLGVDDPVLYSINAFCTRPGGPIRPDIQAWHKDADDIKFIPLFIPLTDGVIQHLRFPDGRQVTITADAGEAFFSNTMMDHYGEPATQERIMCWARWGVSDPPASYVWDKLEPIDKALLGDRYPMYPPSQRMLRLIVR